LDILTIYNYPPFDPHLVFLRMWLHQVSIYNDINLKVKVLSLCKEPKIVKRWHQYYQFEWLKLNQNDKQKISLVERLKLRLNNKTFEYSKLKKHNKLLNHHNVSFKMWNLTQWKSEFVFFDVDAIVFANISHLAKHSSDKPFIGINHQDIPNHTRGKEVFLNGGVQIVSDPKYFSFENYTQITETLLCPGAEQALMFTTFKNENYDYTHAKIGYIWNSCSGYNRVIQNDGKWECFCEGHLERNPDIVSDSIPIGTKIAINHYWDEFKPWKVPCKMFEYFRQTLLVEETFMDRFIKRFYKNTY